MSDIDKDDPESLVNVLERRAGLLRAEIRRIDVLVEELRHIEAIVAYYKDRATVPSADLK